MAKVQQPHPASTERLLGALKEVRTGKAHSSENGSEKNAKERRAGGLDRYGETIGNARLSIREQFTDVVDQFFDERRGVPHSVMEFMRKECPSGTLESREQAQRLGEAVSKAWQQIWRNAPNQYPLMNRAFRESFGHFHTYLEELHLPPQAEIVQAGATTRASTQALLSPAGKNAGAPRAGEPEAPAPTIQEDESSLWQDPEVREYVITEALHRSVAPSLQQLKRELQSPVNSIIGEKEEMNQINFLLCDVFLRLVETSLDGAIAKSRSNDDLEIIKNNFLFALERGMAQLKRQNVKEPQSSMMPFFQRCADSLSHSVGTLTQEFIEGPQDAAFQFAELHAASFLLPATTAFLERREKAEEAWQWTERGREVFARNFNFPKKETELMQPFNPSNNDYIAAAEAVNRTVHAGVKDSSGRSVLLLSDAKSQANYLTVLHAEKQLKEAMPGLVQYAKDLYAECVLKNLLQGTRERLAEESQPHELPNQSKAYLVGKEDFQVSWIPDLQREVELAFDVLLEEVKESPVKLQAALAELCNQNAESFLQMLQEAAAKKFRMEKTGAGALPSIELLAEAIENPLGIYPYKTTVDFKKPVKDILLADRGEEQDFPLMDGEEAILKKAFENFISRKGLFVQHKTYADLLVTLQQKDQPLAVAAEKCNEAFHAGYPFRTANGLLAREALEMLRSHPFTHEPTTQEKQVAAEILSTHRVKDKRAREELLAAINGRLYGERNYRSKAFAKDLAEQMQVEYVEPPVIEPEEKPEVTTVEAALPDVPVVVEPEQPVGREPEEEPEIETAETELPDVPVVAESEEKPLENFEPEKGVQTIEEVIQPEISAVTEIREAVTLPQAIAEWQRLQRQKIGQMLSRFPKESDIAALQGELTSFENAVRHANDRLIRTFTALEEHAGEIGRLSVSQKHVTVIDENFTPTFTRFHQFLNTIAVHEKAIATLNNAYGKREELLGKVNAYRASSEGAEGFFKNTLQEITAGLSPAALGLVDEDAFIKNGELKILHRLELLKGSILASCSFDIAESEFKDEEKRSEYAKRIHAAIEAMNALFKKLTGSAYSLPQEAGTLLVMHDEEDDDEDTDIEEEGEGDGEEIIRYPEEQDNADNFATKETDQNTVAGKLEMLEPSEREIAIHCLAILGAPEWAGNKGTGMKIGKLRAFLKEIFPNLELPENKRGGQNDPLFALLKKVAFIDKTAKTAWKESDAGKKQDEWTNGKVRVESASLEKHYPFVLSLNNHRNFVFTDTKPGEEFIGEIGAGLSPEQSEIYKHIREEQTSRYVKSNKMPEMDV